MQTRRSSLGQAVPTDRALAMQLSLRFWQRSGRVVWLPRHAASCQSAVNQRLACHARVRAADDGPAGGLAHGAVAITAGRGARTGGRVRDPTPCAAHWLPLNVEARQTGICAAGIAGTTAPSRWAPSGSIPTGPHNSWHRMMEPQLLDHRDISPEPAGHSANGLFGNLGRSPSACMPHCRFRFGLQYLVTTGITSVQLAPLCCFAWHTQREGGSGGWMQPQPDSRPAKALSCRGVALHSAGWLRHWSPWQAL